MIILLDNVFPCHAAQRQALVAGGADREPASPEFYLSAQKGPKMRLNPHRPLDAVLARFPECRVIRRLGLAVAAAPCHLLLAAVLRCVKNFLAGLPRLVQAYQAPVTILE